MKSHVQNRLCCFACCGLAGAFRCRGRAGATERLSVRLEADKIRDAETTNERVKLFIDVCGRPPEEISI